MPEEGQNVFRKAESYPPRQRQKTRRVTSPVNATVPKDKSVAKHVDIASRKKERPLACRECEDGGFNARSMGQGSRTARAGNRAPIRNKNGIAKQIGGSTGQRNRLRLRGTVVSQRSGSAGDRQGTFGSRQGTVAKQKRFAR